MGTELTEQLQKSLLTRLAEAIRSGKNVGEVVEILKAAPGIFTSAAEAAKAAGKLGESTAKIAEAEEESARGELQAGAEFYREWMGKAETPEEREKVNDFFQKYTEFTQKIWHDTRIERGRVVSQLLDVAKVVALASAAVALVIVVSRGTDLPVEPG